MLYRWATRFAVVAAVLIAGLTFGRFGSVATAAPAQATTEVEVDDNYFAPKTLTVQAGTTVKWTNEGKREHTVTADNSGFGSPDLEANDNFSFTFNKAGTYAYHCKYHGAVGGKGMSGTIIVKAVSIPAGSGSSTPATLPNTGASGISLLGLAAGALLLGALGLTLKGRGRGAR